MIAPNSPRAEEPSAALIAQATLAALWKRRWRAVLVASAVMGLVVVGLVLAPRVYQSEAKLFVRVGRESIGLDPTATTGQTISVSDSREFEMNSVLDLIDSRAVRERVVDRLGPDYLLNPAVIAPVPADEETTSAPNEIGAAADRQSALRRDQAVRQLISSIKTSAGKRTSVISVSCKAGDPARAQAILGTFLNAFHELHVSASRAVGSHEFFEEQVKLLGEQLAEATGQLGAAKNSFGMVTVEGRQKTLEDQMSIIHAASVKNATALAATEGEIAALRPSIDALPERFVAQEVTGFPDDAVGTTRKQLRELKLKEQELLAKFTGLHPNVIAVRGQIEVAEALLVKQEPNVRQATMSNNPTRDQLVLKLLTDEALAASLRAEAASLDGQRKKLEGELALFNSHDGRVAGLQQRVDALKTTLKAYNEKLEQARIDHALASDRISNVNIVQPATFMPRPVSPKKSLVLFAGAVVAAITGLGAALASEFVPTWMAAAKSGNRFGGGRGDYGYDATHPGGLTPVER